MRSLRWLILSMLVLPASALGQETDPSQVTAEEPSPTSTEADEARLIKQARERLDDKDAEGAYEPLDIYLTQYGHDGVHRFEALGLAVDVLRSLGRNGEALEELDEFKLTDQQGELLVERGELRTWAGRHREAFKDFDAALKPKKVSADVHERAWFGRALSRLKVGNSLKARAEFRQYVAQYPQGRFIKIAAKLARVTTQGAHYVPPDPLPKVN